MKPTKLLAASLTALAFVFVSCEEKKAPVPHDHDGDGVPDHAPGAHPAPTSAPVPHDHDGDGKPDHADGEHGVPEKADPHAGHDHAAVEPDDHAGHDHAKKIAGPNGGKVITTVEPHAEFFVTANRKVRITFLGEDNKGIAVAAQSVGIVCGDRSNPTTLTLVKEADGNSLLSSSALPEGNNFPTIVTLKTTPDAKSVYAKFTLNLTECPSCEYKEYACACVH